MGFIRRLLRGKKHDSTPQQARNQSNKPIHPDLSANLAELNLLFSLTPDLVTRHVLIQSTGDRTTLVYLDGLTDRAAIQDHVLQPLIHETAEGLTVEHIVSIGGVQQASDLGQIEQAILQGRSALLVEGKRIAYLFDTQGWPQRAIEDPQLEASLKGSHQGFVETASMNVALIRRYIPNRELKIKEFQVGQRGATKISVLYLADVANPKILQELETRLQKLDVDAILNAGELEELIEDNPYSPFPQFAVSERPDSVASHILQGRFAVVVDLSPSVLIAPSSFAMFFQSVDDYSIRWQVSSFLRMLRFASFFVTLFLPAIKIIEFRFLERFEIIFLVAYVYMLSRVWIYYLYYAVFGSSQLLGKQDHRPHLRIVVIALLLASFFYSPTFDHIKGMEKWFSQIGVYIAFALPLFLLLYTGLIDRIRKERLG